MVGHRPCTETLLRSYCFKGCGPVRDEVIAAFYPSLLLEVTKLTDGRTLAMLEV